MVFTWAWGEVNIEGSINRWFRTNVTGAGLPSWLTGVTAYFDYPDEPITALPCYTLVHLGHNDTTIAQGNLVQGSPSAVTGRMVDGSLDIGCWVSRRLANSGRNNSAMIQLRSMRDMVKFMFMSAQSYSLPILDIYGTTGTPTGTAGLIRIGEISEVAVETDLNPSILRKRILVDYWWIEKR